MADLVKILRTYIHQRMILAEIAEQLLQRIEKEMDLWARKVERIGYDRMARNQRIEPIRVEEVHTKKKSERKLPAPGFFSLNARNGMILLIPPHEREAFESFNLSIQRGRTVRLRYESPLPGRGFVCNRSTFECVDHRCEVVGPRSQT